MPLWVLSCLGWARRQLAWSNSREAWKERLAVLVLIAGAVGIGWYREHLSVAQELFLWAVLLVAAAVLLRQDWVKLVGPVLTYELVCMARRKRYLLLRWLYGTVLLLMLCWIYLGWILDRVDEHGWTLPAVEMARFAEAFFYSFMGLQFLVLVVLTPAYTAGCIADEKDRKTLEFLLATDLRSREIVLSKLLARLASLAMLLLTGLPVLSLTQFWGGVDPNLVLAGFAATLLTMASLGSFGILCSVYARKARDGIVLTYLGAVGYLSLSALSLMLTWIPGLAPLSLGFGSFTFSDLVATFNTGNVFVALYHLTVTVATGGSLANTLPGILGDYAQFHGVIILGSAVLAVARLRPVALRQTYGQVQKPSVSFLSFRQRRRPAVGRRPMLWKEIFAEPGLRLNWFGRIGIGVLVVTSLLPGGLILGKMITTWWWNRPWAPGQPFSASYYQWHAFVRDMNIWVRVVGAAVACQTLLGVAVRASSSIIGERDRQTWDSLLTTPLSSDSMLFAKWLGSIWSVRWSWLWLGVIWGLGVVSGGLHVLALPLLLGAWGIYAGVFALVGLWYSMTARTSLRATVGTVLTVLAMGVGHWLLWMCCLPLAFFHTSSGTLLFEVLAKTQFGLTPPLVLGGCFSFQADELTHRRSRDFWELLAYGMVGSGCWLVAGVLLAFFLSGHFSQLTGRLRFRPSSAVVRAHGSGQGRPHPVEPPATRSGTSRRDDPGYQPYERQL